MGPKRKVPSAASGNASQRYMEEPALSVKRFYEDARRECDLKPVFLPFPDALITSGAICRPGLALSGFMKRFPNQCIQMIGEPEWAFLKSLSPERRCQAFDAVLRSRVPAVIFADGLRPDADMAGLGRKRRVALFATKLSADAFCELAGGQLRDRFAQRTSVHGTLVSVHGVGLLYVGKSGLGKSECALDLMCKGNLLISDDVVHIVRRGNTLIGECNELLGHHMEIRGIGIVNIRELCGMRSVRSSAAIDAQVELVEWSRTEYFDRTGLDEKTVTILGVPLPHIRIPVSPGKNMSAISEVLALHLLSRRHGKSTIKEFDKKLISHMRIGAAGRGRA